MDAYAILNIGRNSTQREIKEAYRRKVLEHHPDQGGSQEAFITITTAYGMLKSNVESTSNFSSIEQILDRLSNTNFGNESFGDVNFKKSGDIVTISGNLKDGVWNFHKSGSYLTIYCNNAFSEYGKQIVIMAKKLKFNGAMSGVNIIVDELIGNVVRGDERRNSEIDAERVLLRNTHGGVKITGKYIQVDNIYNNDPYNNKVDFKADKIYVDKLTGSNMIFTGKDMVFGILTNVSNVIFNVKKSIRLTSPKYCENCLIKWNDKSLDISTLEIGDDWYLNLDDLDHMYRKKRGGFFKKIFPF